MDIALDLGNVCLRERIERRIAREERGRDQIDPRVRTLRGQAHRDHQLVILLILQRAERIRVFLLQRGNDPGHTFGCFHAFASPDLCLSYCIINAREREPPACIWQQKPV